jgi:CubicO group peptidase (beta-lactamase class C family)
VNLDRRSFFSTGAAALGGFTGFTRKSGAAATPSAAEWGRMADAATRFLKTYEIPGLSLCIVAQGRLVYEAAFGFADMGARTALTPMHRFRIASISKPITSVAVFKLIEQGKLALGNRVFGPSGVLRTDYGALPSEGRVGEITVEHLLTHTSGGWPNDETDPMGKQHGFDHAELIAWTLKTRPLVNAPGTAFAYSNFGYCLLGRIIEKITGRPYAAFVQETVLSSAGATDMQIAGNTLEERGPDEVRYYGIGKDDPYRMNVHRMDSHGGWLARPASVATFATGVDGFFAPALLQRGTVRVMTTPSSANPHYAKGWRVNSLGNWWHTGHLPGVSGLMVRTHQHFCWAALINTRHRNDTLDRDLDRLIWAMIGMVKDWRA